MVALLLDTTPDSSAALSGETPRTSSLSRGSMSGGKLYTYPGNFKAYKALVAAQFSGNQVEVVPNFVFGETNTTAEFLEKFPLGKVPAFESASGDKISDSNAIAYYVASDDLKGQTQSERALVVQWLSFADNELLPAALAWLYPALGLMNFNKQNVDKAKDEVKALLNMLNSSLSSNSHLVGNNVSLADIAVASNLLPLYQNVLEPAFRDSFPHVNKWFSSLVALPQFQAVLGEVKLCEKAAQPETKKKEEKSKAEKKPEKKKEEKKKPAKEDAGDDLDEPLLEQPKQKDPFEVIPKGKFDMDDFKRFYSNNPEEQSIPYFWQKFDKENYSIWFCEYLYPKELTLTFMSCNLISGMYQRLDKLRKNAFGSMILFGEDHNSTISGIWVWRGHELVFTLSPDWQVDYESYSWTKLNPDDEKTKTLVTEYFSWSGDFGGKKFNQGKIFK